MDEESIILIGSQSTNCIVFLYIRIFACKIHHKYNRRLFPLSPKYRSQKHLHKVKITARHVLFWTHPYIGSKISGFFSFTPSFSCTYIRPFVYIIPFVCSRPFAYIGHFMAINQIKKKKMKKIMSNLFITLCYNMLAYFIRLQCRTVGCCSLMDKGLRVRRKPNRFKCPVIRQSDISDHCLLGFFSFTPSFSCTYIRPFVYIIPFVCSRPFAYIGHFMHIFFYSN
jgi:hypothetical protein